MEKLEDALPLEIAARAFCRQDAEGTGVPKNKIQNYVDSNWKRVHTQMVQMELAKKIMAENHDILKLMKD